MKDITNSKIANNAMILAEQFRREGREECLNSGLILSKQQDILEALQIRFERVPEGLREEIEAIGDVEKLALLHRAAIRSANLEDFAAEL